MGKSTLLFNLIRQDIENGEGLAILDPHGDLAEKIIAVLPEHRKKDLIYLDVTDSENPLSFNPLQINDMSRSSLVVSSLMSVFKKIWQDSWGPRMEYILRNALSTLAEFPKATLLDLQRLLNDRKYRAVILAKVKSPQIRAFWEKEFKLLHRPNAGRSNLTDPKQNRSVPQQPSD